ncbi:phosphatase PAP2 family protein [Streptomyces sp. ME08-AFT2]|uniref:phosphatase PAP2 family protein n=1 Tax=Streptomyces sp. ME08-AFT2 TaxID=3028683 RepID=UPI0029B3A4D9|nr:phosphatase PAP2 family protein [Streptomyces sp. ME08-AFT2]MDX3312812.1 phosphatase PAP2 family protein [Streptomyces sp. ME08-AFT2]
MSSRPSRPHPGPDLGPRLGPHAGPLLGPRVGPLLGLLCGLPAVLFAVITWQVAVGGPLLRVDERLSRALVHPDRVSELLADLGEVQIAVPVLVLAAGYVAWRGRAAGGARWWAPPVAALGLLLLVPLIVVPLKEWTDRPGTPAVPPAAGYYPSGHTATAAVAYGSAVLVLLPWLRTALARRTAVAAGVLLVLAVSFALVRHGYHWPLDVVASWCLCAVLLGALWLLLARERRRPRQTVAPEPPTRTTRTSDPSASRPYRGPRKPQDTP